MSGPTDTIAPPKSSRIRPRGLRNIATDVSDVFSGALDLRGFINGYRKQHNPVEVIVRDKYGKVKSIRRQKNLRVTMGRDQWQRILMGGDLSANLGTSGIATATSASSLTWAGAFPGSSALAGHIVVATGTNAAYGVILSNTTTVLTIDQWYTPGSATGAASGTPAATTPFVVLPGAGPAQWIGLSTNAVAPAAGDVVRTADGLYGDGTTGAAASEQNANGLARAFQPCTFPGAGQYQYVHTWTYTAASSVTIAKVVLCNSLAAAGSLLVLETLLSATATVSANGDTIQVTWTVTL